MANLSQYYPAPIVAGTTLGTYADGASAAHVSLANTFTQNQTLDGTNNVAPNQTAASDSSLMTRALVDARAGGPIFYSELASAQSYTDDATGSTICSVTLPAGKYQMEVFARFTDNAANSKITPSLSQGGGASWAGWRESYNNGFSPARVAGTEGTTSGGPWGATTNAANHGRFGILNLTQPNGYSIAASQNTSNATTTTVAARAYILARKIA